MSFGQLPCQSFLKYQKEDEALDQALAEQEEEESGREVRESHSATGQTESGATPVLFHHPVYLSIHKCVSIHCIKYMKAECSGHSTTHT